jgi:hypothetical protein
MAMNIEVIGFCVFVPFSMVIRNHCFRGHAAPTLKMEAAWPSKCGFTTTILHCATAQKMASDDILFQSFSLGWLFNYFTMLCHPGYVMSSELM